MEHQEAERLYDDAVDRLSRSQAAYEFKCEKYRALMESGRAAGDAEAA